MDRRTRRTTIIVIAACVFALIVGNQRSRAENDALPALVAQVQGQWKREQATPLGRVTFVKEHKGNSTTVTARNAADEVLYAHTSEFMIDDLGKVRVFTFFNRVTVAGPEAGQASRDATSFVYRIHHDKFIEVYGLLENDPSPLNVIIWDRVKPSPDQE
jgi:hypothetical protein